MRAPANRSSRTIDLQLTPMIDVVFLLLVFFLWTTSFERPEYDLNTAVALPSGLRIRASSTCSVPT